MLRPVDIQNKEFEKKLKGYDCNEVDDFLDQIISDYELLCKENSALKDKIAMLTEAVDRYKLMETTLRQSLDVAKQSAAETRNSAKVEAEGIIARAKLDAENLSRQIDEEHLRRHQEMLSVKTQIEGYKARVKAMTGTLLKTLEEM